MGRVLRYIGRGNTLIIGVIVAAVVFSLFDSCEQYEDDVYYLVDSSLCVGCQVCVDVCQENAISMVDGKAVIDEEKCIGCGKCGQECGLDAIYISTSDYNSTGTTDSTDSDTSSDSNTTERTIYKVISGSCVGCGACLDACPVDAITFEDGKAVIDSSLCVGCGKCAKACGFNAIAKEE